MNKCGRGTMRWKEGNSIAALSGPTWSLWQVASGTQDRLLCLLSRVWMADTLRNAGGACKKQASAMPRGREGGGLVGSSKTPQRRREDRRNQWGIGPLTEKLDQVDNRGPERGGKRGAGTS